MKKICTKCKVEKELTEFHNKSEAKDGKNSACKSCRKIYLDATREKRLAYNKAWRGKNKEKLSQYYKDNKEKISAQQKEYQNNNKEKRAQYLEDNKEILIAKRKERYKDNKEKVLSNQKEYYEDNKEKISQHRKNNKEIFAARNKEYRENNRDKINANSVERRKTNPQSKASHNLRDRIIKALKAQGTFKSESTIKLVGASIPFVKKWIESKFKPGMSWDNYGKGKGKWNIDHIRPCASFDLTDLEQQRECFHYSNLQPLWSEDNLIKGDRYNPD